MIGRMKSTKFKTQILTRVTPYMTGETEPYNKAYASSVYDDAYGWKAFSDPSLQEHWAADFNVKSATLTYEFDNPVTIRAFQYGINQNTTKAPKDYIVELYVDGSWETVLTKTDEPILEEWGYTPIYEFEAKTCTRARLNIDNINGGDNINVADCVYLN